MCGGIVLMLFPSNVFQYLRHHSPRVADTPCFAFCATAVVLQTLLYAMCRVCPELQFFSGALVSCGGYVRDLIYPSSPNLPFLRSPEVALEAFILW